MSVFGSLFTAVSGLSAQAQSMGMISNNIANIATVGYKRTDAAFSSLVTNSSQSTLYTPGSVSVSQNQRINLQGILQQSASATDLAMSGNGFFVARSSPTDPNAETVFTRAGSFSEDQNGNLVNTAGYSLFGYALDQNENIIGSPASVSSLVPINVAFPNGLTQPTSTISMTANLDSTQAVSLNTSDFSRDITIYDSLGNPHTITAEFKRLAPANGTATGTIDLSTVNGNFVPGTSTFDVDTTTYGTTTITLDGDVNKMLTDLNAITGITANLDTNNHLVIQATTAGDTLTLTDGTNTPLATDIGITAGAFTYTDYTPGIFTGLTTPTTPNSDGWWKVSFDAGNPAMGQVGTGYINFDTTGALNHTDITPPTTPGQVNVQLNTINWPGGANPQTIDFDLSNIVQNSGPYNVSNVDQNGTPLGYKTGVAVGEDGKVNVQFSNGLSRNVYQLAIGMFSNPNGLTPLTGNVFRISDTSGNVILQTANSGGAGTVQGGALEQANVDLADEFSKMIITQRAYSANTKVISTADQMTQDLLNIR